MSHHEGSSQSLGIHFRGQFLPLALVGVMAALLYFTSLGRSPLLINAEIRCYGITEAMLQSHDYLVPRLNTVLRTQKPPLLYWMACAASKMVGRFNVFALRLPSVVAALGILYICVLWCREL